uniref:Uncharacterized protein n=1 Tax=Lepeophtheirus salmonis TaxID=72036 RepID=A0A0K2VIV3_LEPSM|nr:uncharacterized protein LOC121117872 [Lepeophtheirus salmonis]
MNIFYACLCLVSSFLIVIIEVESQKNSRIFVGDGIISKRSFLYHPRNIYRQRHPRRQKVQPSKPTSLQSIVHGKETPGYGRDVIRRIDYDIPPNRLLMPDYEFLRRDSRGRISFNKASKRIDDEGENAFLDNFSNFSEAAFFALKLTARMLDLYKSISFFLQ